MNGKLFLLFGIILNLNEINMIVFGIFILTGSISNINSKNQPLSRHTETLRIKKIMRIMSLFESKDSNGLVSLSNLKENMFTVVRCDKTLSDYAYFICQGKWPLSLSFNDEKTSLYQAKAFYSSLVSEDMFTIKDLKIYKDEQKASSFLDLMLEISLLSVLIM